MEDEAVAVEKISNAVNDNDAISFVMPNFQSSLTNNSLSMLTPIHIAVRDTEKKIRIKFPFSKVFRVAVSVDGEYQY